MPKSEIQDRIGELIRSTGLNNYAFARKLNKTNSVIDRIVKGKTTGERNKPSYDLLELILKTKFPVGGRELRVNPTWLMTGEGEKWVDTVQVEMRNDNAAILRELYERERARAEEYLKEAATLKYQNAQLIEENKNLRSQINKR